MAFAIALAMGCMRLSHRPGLLALNRGCGLPTCRGSAVSCVPMGNSLVFDPAYSGHRHLLKRILTGKVKGLAGISPFTYSIAYKRLRIMPDHPNADPASFDDNSFEERDIDKREFETHGDDEFDVDDAGQSEAERKTVKAATSSEPKPKSQDRTREPQRGPAAVGELREWTTKLGIQVSVGQLTLIDEYRRELWGMNELLNLTRHTTIEKFATRDLLDTWELQKLIGPDESVLDIGTGGGVPGILLAIMRPDLTVALAESVGKKAEAVENFVSRLQLPITVFAARAEDALVDYRFDVCVARGVGPLWKICFWLKDCWENVGRLLAIKGPNWVEERKEARHRGGLQNVELRCAATYPMYGTESSSVILKLWPKSEPEKENPVWGNESV
jgi:16S rRNA (guanine527-N7)-methyltransferase